MNPRPLLVALALFVPAGLTRADDVVTKKVLFFSKSSGYEHSVIKLPGSPFKPGGGSEVPGLAFQVLKEIGARDHIDFVFSKDGSLFTPEYLAGFDAIYFHTTGDLTTVGTDGNPAMTPAGKEALLKAVEGGKGFIGTHCATDTFHSPGGADIAGQRFFGDGANADAYIKMIGGEFIIHGAQQKSHLIVIDPKFPGMSAVAPDNSNVEEWYAMKDFASNLHVLLVQDTAGMKGEPYQRPNYPSTWARVYGKGRVFYTNLGHRDDMWNSAMFQAVLQGGLDWALGRVDADVTPNLDTAAPQAGVLPPPPPPKK